MAHLQLKAISKSFGNFQAVRDINLDIKDREFVVLVGPSGCGKSTLLRMIAGLETISSGDLFIDGERVNGREPDERGLAMVFQSYALYPHMTVEQNMGFALRLAGVPKDVRHQKVLDAARKLQLESMLDRRPSELSGGQRQRVAIGRTIVRDPKAFLFDEPLSNLDAALRGQMRIELAKMHQELEATMVYVTHDQVEAMTMADRIVVLRNGSIEQMGPPVELYQNPATAFVAGFLGSPKMNLFDVSAIERSHDSTVVILSEQNRLKLGNWPVSGRQITVGIRPEAVQISNSGDLVGKVEVVEHLGAEQLIYLNIGTEDLLTVRCHQPTAVKIGEPLRVEVDPSRMHVFDANGRAVMRNAA
ncbi:sn-glycerol-3-phosphate ABC transporter ATP-binding protein UgpC [Chelativorans sp. M5D2P16]|uniref:ABC transporter ATP-binding protein n=1 Tax=Chelativorans sp. M5D2P16 TaxID=3095678 RepID=UPI002ACA95EB|nr:sn-glycerol-3-phosphate ABC transporter ATP-binding protein UgpC [Chelativorans sp. M5D2P16]MDZ5698668.1 sn-glycerol-3-phosphate ABC transporter ATP-binding protein UgpC [Chelativorans sp. M5D2P16]